MGKPIIELKGITKVFGTGDASVTALKDVDLTIDEGEIFVTSVFGMGTGGPTSQSIPTHMDGFEPSFIVKSLTA